jgi:asparagine synthetase B (glutamine-hydrolysing)
MSPIFISCALCSGGIDCTVTALLAHHAAPPEEPIDLISVAFRGDREPAEVLTTCTPLTLHN